MPKLFIISSVLGILGLMPLVGHAQTITLDEVSPIVDEDITPPDNQKAGEENFYTFWFKGQIGTEYTATFDVSEEPAFTFVSGGDMSLENNVSYDAEAGTFSVTYEAVPLQQIDAESSLVLEENQTLTIVAVSFPVAEGENGPGEEVIGSWLASNFQEWALTTPSEDNNAMGATVQGDAGDTGDFEMYMPSTALSQMAEYDDTEDYTAEDMAVYEDGEKVSQTVEAASGGAYISFSTTLPEESSDEEGLQSTFPSTQGVSQSITVAPIEAISLNASKARVEKGGYVKLSGKIKSGLKGKTVSFWRRFEDGKLKKFDSVKTKKNGKFELRVKIKRNVMFKVKHGSDSSDSVYVQVQ